MDQKTVEDYLDEIIENIRKESGYPYPEDLVTTETSRPFAYGLAMGYLMSAKKEWARRMEG